MVIGRDEMSLRARGKNVWRVFFVSGLLERGRRGACGKAHDDYLLRCPLGTEALPLQVRSDARRTFDVVGRDQSRRLAPLSH